MNQWYAHVKVTAKKYNLDPNLCAALAAGESGIGNKEVRFSWVGHGKYLGPYNLHYSVVERYNVTDWKSCTEVGIMLLSNKLNRYGSLHNALRHYNTDDKGVKFNRYVNNIKRLQRQYKKRRVFIDEPKNYSLKMTK